MWETAVRRCPKNLDYEGLDAILSPTVDEGGAVCARIFTDWVAGQQKNEAMIAKTPHVP